MNPPDDVALAALAQRVALRLSSAGLKLATAESCTGGFLSKLLTDIPGSSAWFECGWVCYSNRAKQRDLAVPAAILAEHGAVSEAVALGMALGAIEASGADRSLSITGVAGPDGGTARHPVGEVWFGLGRRREEGVMAEASRQRWTGDRDAVRRQSVAFALEWLLAN